MDLGVFPVTYLFNNKVNSLKLTLILTKLHNSTFHRFKRLKFFKHLTK